MATVNKPIFLDETGQRIVEAIQAQTEVIQSVSSASTNSFIDVNTNGNTVTFTKADGTTKSITTQDTNTTYSTMSASEATTGTATTGRIITAKVLNDKISEMIPASLPANGGNANTVSGFTVGVNVPANAKFTDTTYSAMSADEATTGTATTARSITAKVLNDKITAVVQANAYSLPTASSSLGGVKTTSTVTSTSGLTACPIISGVPYYKDTNNTYTLSSFNVTATASELNVLDGITATTTELNYCDGVTSNIQTQLNGKLSTSGTAASASKLSSNGGSATQPIYFSNGVPAACTYTLEKSVPSNAVFTDTNTKVTNTLATTTKAYVTGTTSATTNTGTQVFDTGVYLDTVAGGLVAKTFKTASGIEIY